jgi:two-component system, cell cycle sensor histidine kinase and response regulator CckA
MGSLVLTAPPESSCHDRTAAAEQMAVGIMAHAAEAIIVCDERGLVIRANEAARRFCDGGPLLRPFAEGFPLFAAPSIPFALAPVLLGETLREVPVALDWQGQVVEFVLNAGPLLRGHQVRGCVVALADVTERKRSAEALQSSEARFQEMFDGAPVGYHELDAEGRVIRVNRTELEMLGYSAGEMLGHHVWEFLHDSDRSHRSVEDKLAGAVAIPSYIERTYRRKDGTLVPVLIQERLVRGSHGIITGIRTTVQDNTERTRAAEALGASELSYRRLFETAKDGILILDADTGAIVDVNPFLSELLCFPHEAVLGMRVWDLGFFKDIIANQDSFAELQREGYVRYADKPLQASDGRRIDVEFVSNVYLVNNRRVIQCNIRDVTEHKKARDEHARLEAQLRQTQKMESVGRLAGGVAHDFNNMLGVILGHAELALAQVAPNSPLHADLMEIRDAAERSAELTRQLLAFARQQRVAPRVLDLNETVADTLKMLQRMIGERISLTWRPGADLWPVRVDRSQIGQILTNLCVNASDAIATVGSIGIETANVTLDASGLDANPALPQGDFVLLTLSDNGCGMEKDTLSHAFEPFFTTKRFGDGTGLGLATVYGIVQQNHGVICVDSEPNCGTTFRIYLPRHTGPAGRDETEGVVTPTPTGRETILLVEDEPAILALTKRMLERCGYTVLSAGAPGEAMCAAARHAGAIDLVITDVIMPEMNGQVLVANLLALRPRVKRLFMSGYTADVLANQGGMGEGVQFIQKPFSAEVLATKVRAVLDAPE